MPAEAPVVQASIQVLFTPSSFRLDCVGAETDPYVKKWKDAFGTDPDEALFLLGFEEKPGLPSPSFQWLHLLSSRFVGELTQIPGIEMSREQTVVEPSEETVRKLIYSVPFALGSENVGKDWILGIFRRLNDVFCRKISDYDGTVAIFLTELSQRIRVPERIFFHLVENKETDYPFAFLATYATKGEDGHVRHMPLSYALVEYKNQREKLITLLSCLNRAADVSPMISIFMESGELFHPLRLTSEEAYEFLQAVPAIEEAGILCRVPNWWKQRSAMLGMSVDLGEEKPAFLGFDSLVSMVPHVTLDGTPLTAEDIKELLSQTEGLARLKGKWVEVDHARLRELLKEMEQYRGDLTLLEALRMQTGVSQKVSPDIGLLISNGAWLGGLLSKLRQPASIQEREVPSSVRATLRAYQHTGYNWLNYMNELGFGACLADDMGLGKTLQILTFLSGLYEREKDARILLVVPASLLGNWEKEAEKFTPSLPFCILHGLPTAELTKILEGSPAFLTITTYGMVARIEKLQEIEWTCVILDEAQAIKNPGTKQTRTIKKLKAVQRIAMTGTPIENELANLWSLFDFLNKGLLGSSKEFRDFSKQLEKNSEGYQKLKNMVAPFILRRLKTDKSIIADLPEKMEQIDYVSMSKKQIVLYRKQVADLERALADVKGMQRRGLVLATITKLKQICNHPDQFLGQNGYAPEESGKFALLREICETIYEKRERVLIFTQYREITDQLASYLASIFGRKGLVLHGGTHVKKRAQMVEQFNGDEYVPFMILSLKAGGTGLNLTSANHVIHFDRWWNPAVENQATDRAFRIGQQKNVIVHKLVSEGTIEEKIDAMINSKKELAENVIGSGGENWITELGDSEILNLMRLEV